MAWLNPRFQGQEPPINPGRFKDPWTAERWASEYGLGYEDLVTVFADLGLTAPPVPRSLRGVLRSRAPHAWSTEALGGLPVLYDDQWRLFERRPVGNFVAVDLWSLIDNRRSVNFVAIFGPLAMWAQHSISADGGGVVETAAMLAGLGTLLRSVEDQGLDDLPVSIRVVYAPEGLRTGIPLTYCDSIDDDDVALPRVRSLQEVIVEANARIEALGR